MWVALTGTPGTGKSSVAILLKKRGYTVIQLHRFARENNCIEGMDLKRNTELVNIHKLNTAIKKHITTNAVVFFEGHLSHLLKIVDKVIILRCNPKVLKGRLMKKKWDAKKIKENLDAETIDVILCETVEYHLKENIFEINTTKKTIEEVTTIILNLIKKKFQPTETYTIGQIDWSDEIFKEY